MLSEELALHKVVISGVCVLSILIYCNYYIADENRRLVGSFAEYNVPCCHNKQQLAGIQAKSNQLRRVVR